jgi:plastocyanin
VNLDRFHNRIGKVCAFVAATLLTVLTFPQVLWGANWSATVGVQSNDLGRQGLAFLPNEIWIHAGDSITWTFVVNEIHTVTFLADGEALARPPFQAVTASPDGSSFDNTATVTTGALARGIPGTPPVTFTVNFPTPGNYKQVCLVHNNMTGVVHVLAAGAPLPHDQAFYNSEAADQARNLLSDQDGGSVSACGGCPAANALVARVVAAGTGEISATPGGDQTLSVMRFLSDNIQIRVNDIVEWTNQSPVEPHTVTFGTEPTGDPTIPINVSLDPDGARSATVSSPNDNVHSGFIVASLQDQQGQPQTPLGVTRFRVKFTSPGVFSYICVLHDTLGMKGTVTVH